MDEHFKSKFKTEKDRLKKQKEAGGAYQDTLTKVASRNNIVFTDKGVVKHELTSPVGTPRRDEEEKPLAQQGRGLSSTSAASTPISTTKADTTSAFTSQQQTAAVAKKAPAAASTTITPTTKTAPVATTSVVVKKEVPKPIVYEEAPVADPQPESPRLVSEAEKILQERVRTEAEADHKKKMQNLEDEWSRKTTELRQTADNDVAETKRQLNVNKRNQIAKIEDSLQEELEQQQRNVDQRSKRDIQQLQDDIEEVREKSRAVQQGSSNRATTDFADVERRMKDALASKVADIEGEISSIRMRHAKAQIEKKTSDGR
ncbi:Hypothetical protein, putative [Bodo saltans]|uniref:Uncharacterized protein n=1 Tax=Bodo saltans TaxID=75058 RepID=A0A0S4IYD2_BODSA|nr:Hypothetical protein, putative [Bodo saltans]|eukprot:CUF97825.1 Hypothetical protein, putative [Bodo saltans]